jgi:transposase InsO family protein
MNRRFSPAKTAFMDETTVKWLQGRLIEESDSEHNAPVHIATRPVTGAMRMCSDYKRSGYNDAHEDMQFPMPTVDDIHRELRGARVLGKLDARNAYMQCLVGPATARRLAFSTTRGHFQPLRVPFGPKNAPRYFQKCMSGIVLANLEGVRAYLDDIVIWADTEVEFRQRLRAVLERCRRYRIRLRGDKTELGREEIELLGHYVSGQGMRLSEERRQGVADIVKPTNASKLRTFLGIAGYHRRYVKDFSLMTKKLSGLTEKGARWLWTAQHQEAFDEIKRSIMAAPILAHVDENQQLFLATDACDIGCGGYLYQVGHDGAERVIAYISYAFNAVERRWSTFEQEAFAIYYCVLKLEQFLHGRYFVVKTDHKNLLYMMQASAPKVVRWRLLLQGYNFDVEHVAGKDNVVPDALSRCFSITEAASITQARVRRRVARAKRRAVADQVREQQRRHGPLASIAEGQDEPAALSLNARSAISSVGNDARGSSVDSDARGGSVGNDARGGSVGNDARGNSVGNDARRSSAGNDARGSSVGNDARGSSVGNDATEGVLGAQPRDKTTRQEQSLTAATRELAKQNLRIVHNTLAGHLGVAKTLAKLKQAGVAWKGMTADVKKYIASCALCQKVKKGKLAQTPPGDLRVGGGVFQDLMVDSIGPLVEDEHGMEYIIVVMCRFSRFVECIATRDVGARSAAAALVSVLGRYGIASTLWSDQGSQYKNSLIDELVRMVGLRQKFGIANHSQSNGTVERANAEVLKHLRALTWNFGAFERWSELLPMAQRIINNSVHSATGVAPASIVFGNRIDLDREIVRQAESYGSATWSDWASEVAQAQAEIVEASEHWQTSAADKKLRQRGPPEGQAPQLFAAGDTVLALAPHGKRVHKLAPLWWGPFVVLRREGTSAYACKDILDPTKVVVFAAMTLKPFVVDVSVQSKDLRALDNGELVVARILRHRFCPPLRAGESPRARQHKKRLQFEVEWRGIVPPEPSWLNYTKNERLEALLEYGRANPELGL